ncbi:hypothetical protein VN96_1343 [Lactococcus cremoris]|nr:hypothetical protein VN96_1343 [Lactococcus cremoris]
MKNFEVSPEKDHKSMDTFLEDWDYYATLRQYALENKTIDGYKNGRYIVKNRTEIATKLDSYEEVYYDLEAPLEKENYLTNKLIVFFMPADAMTSPSAEKRYFGNARWGFTCSIYRPKIPIFCGLRILISSQALIIKTRQISPTMKKSFKSLSKR